MRREGRRGKGNKKEARREKGMARQKGQTNKEEYATQIQVHTKRKVTKRITERCRINDRRKGKQEKSR